MREINKSLEQIPPSKPLISHFSIASFRFALEALEKICREAWHSMHDHEASRALRCDAILVMRAVTTPDTAVAFAFAAERIIAPDSNRQAKSVRNVFLPLVEQAEHGLPLGKQIPRPIAEERQQMSLPI